MIIVKDDLKTTQICSKCSHKYVIYTDGKTEGEPFTEYERKLCSHKFWEEDTPMGKRIVPHEFKYTGYVCPKCGQLQVTQEDAIDMNDRGAKTSPYC